MEDGLPNRRLPMWPVWVIIGIAVASTIWHIDFFPGGPDEYTMVVPFVPDDVSEGAQHTMQAIDAVLFRQGDYVGMATGMTIRPGLVLTVAHAIPEGDFDDLKVFCNERFVDAEVLEVHRSRDIALLTANCDSDRHVFYVGDIDMDEPLMLSGYDFTFDSESRPALTAIQTLKPTSLVPLVSLHADGMSDEDVEDDEARKLVLDMDREGLPPLVALSGMVKRGFSGSPVFRSDGSVVGIAVISSATHCRTFIVPVITIIPVLAEHVDMKDLE